MLFIVPQSRIQMAQKNNQLREKKSFKPAAADQKYKSAEINSFTWTMFKMYSLEIDSNMTGKNLIWL